MVPVMVYINKYIKYFSVRFYISKYIITPAENEVTNGVFILPLFTLAPTGRQSSA